MLLAFPVLGLRQPPARERVFSVRPWWKGHARVVNAGAHLLEHGDFTVRPEALVGVANLDEIDVPAWRFLCSACKCTCTSLPLRETRWTGDTNVDIGLGRAVGSLVACNSACHVLTCHSNSDSLVVSRPTTLSSASRASLEQQAKQRRPTLPHLAHREQ